MPGVHNAMHQMGRVVRFEFFTSFYVYLPFTKTCFPCPLVMADIETVEKVDISSFGSKIEVRYTLICGIE
jgi:hypothetical protein